MKSIIPLFILLTIGCLTSFAQSKEEKQLTDADKIYGLSKLCTEVKYNFVYYDKLNFDWDSLCIASIPKVLAANGNEEYCKELQKICVLLQDGHTGVRLANPSSPDDWMSHLGLTTKMFNGRIFVNDVFCSEYEKVGVVKGLEILKINDDYVLDYANKHVKPYVSYSTPQWQEYLTYENYNLTKGRKGDLLKIQFKDAKGKVFDCELSRKAEWDKKISTYSFDLLNHNIGYLKISTFNDRNMHKSFDELYDRILTTDALILDLRGNGGGNTYYADYILRHFSKKPFSSGPWSSRLYNATHASWGYPQEWYTQSSTLLYPVEKDIYSKPIVVLCDKGTYSSAEDFCIKFLGMNRGKLVGSKTGGSTGNPIVVKLIENVASAQICTRKCLAVDGSEFVGIGIKPQIEIQETMDDFLRNKDVVLDKALEYLSKK